MTFEQRVHVVAIIAKYLRTFGTVIAAIGAEKKAEGRALLVERLATELSEEPLIWDDILYVFSAVLGNDKLKSNIDLRTVVNEFTRGWKHNRLDNTMLFCLEADIISKPDFANALWVLSNWRVMSGKQRST